MISSMEHGIDSFLNRAEQLLSIENWEEAKNVLRQALSIDSSSERALSLMKSIISQSALKNGPAGARDSLLSLMTQLEAPSSNKPVLLEQVKKILVGDASLFYSVESVFPILIKIYIESVAENQAKEIEPLMETILLQRVGPSPDHIQDVISANATKLLSIGREKFLENLMSVHQFDRVETLILLLDNPSIRLDAVKRIILLIKEHRIERNFGPELLEQLISYLGKDEETDQCIAVLINTSGLLNSPEAFKKLKAIITGRLNDLAKKANSEQESLSLLNALFLIDTETAASIASQAKVLDLILADETLEFESHVMQLSALTLLNFAISSSKDLRCKAISLGINNQLSAIERSKRTSAEVKDLCQLILSKLMISDNSSSNTLPKQSEDLSSLSSSPLEICQSIIESVLDGNKKQQKPPSVNMESLAVLSLKPACKEYLTQVSLENSNNSTDFWGNLYKSISSAGSTNKNSSNSTAKFGLSQIILNLVTFPRVLTEEEKQVQQLHKFASKGDPLRAGQAEEPEETDEIVEARITKLVKHLLPTLKMLLFEKDKTPAIVSNVVQALQNIVRVQSTRPLVVQTIGVKALLNAFHQYKSGSDDRQRANCANLLSRLAITLNPNLAFPHQIIELISPLLSLLDPNKVSSELQASALFQFEALLALTNIASTGPAACEKIMREGGLKAIEAAQFSDNEQVQLAATEALCNLCGCDSIIRDWFEPKPEDRCKILLALISGLDSDDDIAAPNDFKLVRAASGALAMLSQSPTIVRSWLKSDKGLLERFANLAINLGNQELNHRGLVILQGVCMVDLKAVRAFPGLMDRLKTKAQILASKPETRESLFPLAMSLLQALKQ